MATRAYSRRFFGCSCCTGPIQIAATSGTDRRRLLAGALATLGLAATGSVSPLPAQPAANPRR